MSNIEREGIRSWWNLYRFLVLGFCLTLGSCSTCFNFDAKHSAVGTWKGKWVSIQVDSDHVASVNGARFSWAPVDDSTIRLEFDGPQELKDLPVLIHLRITDAEGRQATVNLAGFDVVLTRQEREISRTVP
jgi:hypothetical protein